MAPSPHKTEWKGKDNHSTLTQGKQLLSNHISIKVHDCAYAPPRNDNSRIVELVVDSTILPDQISSSL